MTIVGEKRIDVAVFREFVVRITMDQ